MGWDRAWRSDLRSFALGDESATWTEDRKAGPRKTARWVAPIPGTCRPEPSQPRGPSPVRGTERRRVNRGSPRTADALEDLDVAVDSSLAMPTRARRRVPGSLSVKS